MFGIKTVKEIKKADKEKKAAAKEKQKFEKAAARTYERSGHGGASYDIETGEIHHGAPENPTKKQSKDFKFAKKNRDFLRGKAKHDPLSGAKPKTRPASKDLTSKKHIAKANAGDDSQAPFGKKGPKAREYKEKKHVPDKYKIGKKAGDTLNDPIKMHEEVVDEGIRRILRTISGAKRRNVKKLLSKRLEKAETLHKAARIGVKWAREDVRPDAEEKFKKRSKVLYGTKVGAKRRKVDLETGRKIEPMFASKKKKTESVHAEGMIEEAKLDRTPKAWEERRKRWAKWKSDNTDKDKKKKEKKEEIKEGRVGKIKLTGKKLTKKEFAKLKADALAKKVTKETTPKKVEKTPEESGNDLDMITQHPKQKQIRSALSNFTPEHRSRAQNYLSAAIRAKQENKVSGFLSDPHATVRGLLEKKPKSKISLAGPEWSKS